MVGQVRVRLPLCLRVDEVVHDREVGSHDLAVRATLFSARSLLPKKTCSPSTVGERNKEKEQDKPSQKQKQMISGHPCDEGQSWCD